MAEVQVIISGKHRELSNCGKQIYYRIILGEKNQENVIIKFRLFTGKLVKVTKESYRLYLLPACAL